jgi:asparagine synthase (glutamine-hydrolysing)
MCGICGFIDSGRRLGPDTYPSLIEAMTTSLAHRGPDDGGRWVDPAARAALGHRRLAVIDPSAEGHQPMLSGDGRVAVSFNGEIYNYRTLRDELAAAGCRFRGHSDTEVLVEALARWGPQATLARIDGIFAFAAWEVQERRLTLARDHLGVKPLYWGRLGSGLMFASELRALRVLPGWSAEVAPSALTGLIRYGHVSAPDSIYRRVYQLPAGTQLTWTPDRPPAEHRYYDLAAVARAGQAEPLALSEDAAIDRLEGLLDTILADQMVADVPLGAFLSGGIDSTTVVALMQRRADRPVRTFTIGFGHRDYDEARHAAAVARHLGTEHSELYVGERDLLDLVPRLAEIYDEPFADASQLPTLLISELARSRVTVALSGDGGDELFAGYARHLWAGRVWRRIGRYPIWLRRLAAHALQLPPPAVWRGLAAALPPRVRPRLLGHKAHKLTRALVQPGLADIFDSLRALNPAEQRLVRASSERPRPLQFEEGLDDLSALQLADALGYLPDDILTKVDRASMRHGLEVRVPLLDRRLVELAWRLPPALKVRGGRGKWLLRALLHRHVPAALVDRPKAGFSVPIDAWLRGPLRDWGEALLVPETDDARELLDLSAIRDLWRIHLDGTSDLGLQLWPCLMFLAWFEHWMGAPSVASVRNVLK